MSKRNPISGVVRCRLIAAMAVAVWLIPGTVSAQLATEIIDSTAGGTGSPLSNPGPIVTDNAGSVFIAGQCSHNVLKITPAGAIIRIVDTSGDGSGNAQDDPRARQCRLCRSASVQHPPLPDSRNSD